MEEVEGEGAVEQHIRGAVGAGLLHLYDSLCVIIRAIAIAGWRRCGR